MDTTIRPYAPRDRQDVRRIFQETAFHGDSYARFFDDGDWLADFMVDGYLEFGTEACFVAEAEGKVVGYLTGTLDSSHHYAMWSRKILPRIFFRFVSKGLWASQKNWTFFLNGLRSAMRGEESIPKGLFVDFPAHFHINVDKSVRGQGIGDSLAQAFFNLVRTSGVKGVHVRTARSDGKHPFFESLGFIILLKKRLTVWDHLGATPYQLLTYGLKIKNENK